MNRINSLWGVEYKDSGVIIATKTPNNDVYPSDKSNVFGCDSEYELKEFIIEKQLFENGGFAE